MAVITIASTDLTDYWLRVDSLLGIVSGDIGCYTLGVMPPFNAIHSCVCMGASVTVGLGMRKMLPEAEARKVVSVIGDSTFLHTGINGIVEMMYNPPATGHVVIILDNGKNIYPEEIEVLIDKIPYVVENVVMGEEEGDDYRLVAHVVYDPEAEELKGKTADEIQALADKDIETISSEMHPIPLDR